MRPLLFIILILTLVACTRQNSADKSLTEEFKYSAFLWHLSPDNDSFNFYLAHYIDVDKDGRLKIMRRDSFMSRPQFFAGILSDTLLKLIGTTFLTDTFNTDYKWNVNDNFTYDGFTYAIDFKMADTIQTKRIYFIPNKTSSEINQLATKLDTLIYNLQGETIDTFDTHLYQEQLKRDYVTKYGQLPKVHREQPKFRPVKLRK